ncbi:MAG: dihydrofolate reductase [Myxococcales bacterium]|nr:dihydrofolate reductase [Myxococcales bacterium]
MQITLIAALTPARVIGRDGGLPWRLPDDLRRFKAETMGKPLLMGRRTFASIGRALPGRRTVVLSRDPNFSAPGVEVVPDLATAWALLADCPEVMVGGGAQIYAEALPCADRLLLTLVHADVDGDVHFPPIDAAQFGLQSREDHPADARHAWPFTLFDLRRVDSPRLSPLPAEVAALGPHRGA